MIQKRGFVGTLKEVHNTVVDSQSLSHTRMHMQKSVFTNLILGSPVHNYFSLSSAQAHCRLSATAVQEPSSISLSPSPQQYPLYLPPQLKANYSPQIRNTIFSVILLWTATAKEIKFLLKLIKDKLSVILGGLRIFFCPLFLLCSVIFPSLSCLIFNCQLSNVLACWRRHLCWHGVCENERIGPTHAHEHTYIMFLSKTSACPLLDVMNGTMLLQLLAWFLLRRKETAVDTLAVCILSALTVNC